MLEGGKIGKWSGGKVGRLKGWNLKFLEHYLTFQNLIHWSLNLPTFLPFILYLPKGHHLPTKYSCCVE